MLFQIIVVCVLSLLLGIASLYTTPLVILGISITPIVVYAILKRTEIGLLGILIATSSIVFEDQLPLFSLGGISLHLTDFFLAGMLGIVVVRWLIEPRFQIVRTPLDWPLLIFVGLALLSTFIAIFRSSVDVVEARRAIRTLSYYLIFFIVTNLVKDRRQMNFLLNGIFLMATIVAVAMIVQFLLGDTIRILPGRVETLNTQGTIYEDVARILPPGWSIIIVSFVAIFCVLVQEKFKTLTLLKFLQFGLLGIAIVITFVRAYWAGLTLVFFLLTCLVKGSKRQKIFGWGMVILFILATILLYSTGEPKSQVGKLIGATYSRLETLWSAKTLNESSLQFRYVENGYVLPNIIAHPLLGLGFGARYRPYDPRIDSREWNGRNYIHNGHLWILLDSGIIGYLAFIWLSLTFLIRGFRGWRSVASDKLKGVVLGFTLVYVAALIAAVTVPTFTVRNWITVIGVIMGINEVILSRFGWEAVAA